jgi:hypothetical protein
VSSALLVRSLLDGVRLHITAAARLSVPRRPGRLRRSRHPCKTAAIRRNGEGGEFARAFDRRGMFAAAKSGACEAMGAAQGERQINSTFIFNSACGAQRDGVRKQESEDSSQEELQ